MKLHLFYKIKNKEDMETSISPFLYAYTVEKNLSDAFKRTRDMDIFYEKKIEIDKDDLTAFMAKHGTSLMLTTGRFITRSRINFESSTMCQFVCTMAEEENVVIKADDGIVELGKLASVDLSCLKSKYLKVLDDLEYFSAHRFYSADSSYFYDGVSTRSLESLQIDQISLFIYFYGKTLK